MSSKLYDLLKGSSLRGLLSNSEIEEVYEELSTDFNDFIEEEQERLMDEAKGTTEINNLKEDIADLEIQLAKASKSALPNKTLSDTMTLEWIKENWDSISQLYNLNKTGKEIVNTYKYGETLMGMGREAAPEVAKMIDAQIVKDVVALSHEAKPDTDQMARQFEEKKPYRHKRIVLVGRAASGKDHMRKQLEAKGYKYAISYTTRPPRTGEVDGKDYFFLSPEQFKEMIDNNEFYEYVDFNGWFYGTSKIQFFRDDIFIMTPHGISCIKPEDRGDSFIMYFDMKEGVRRRRLMERSDADKVDRRLEADNLDFADFKDFDVRFTNHDF